MEGCGSIRASVAPSVSAPATAVMDRPRPGHDDRTSRWTGRAVRRLDLLRGSDAGSYGAHFGSRFEATSRQCAGSSHRFLIRGFSGPWKKWSFAVERRAAMSKLPSVGGAKWIVRTSHSGEVPGMFPIRSENGPRRSDSDRAALFCCLDAGVSSVMDPERRDLLAAGDNTPVESNPGRARRTISDPRRSARISPRSVPSITAAATSTRMSAPEGGPAAGRSTRTAIGP